MTKLVDWLKCDWEKYHPITLAHILIGFRPDGNLTIKNKKRNAFPDIFVIHFLNNLSSSNCCYWSGSNSCSAQGPFSLLSGWWRGHLGVNPMWQPKLHCCFEGWVQKHQHFHFHCILVMKKHVGCHDIFTVIIIIQSPLEEHSHAMMLKHHATRHLLPPLSQPHQWDLSFPGEKRRALGCSGHAAERTAEQVIRAY